MALLKGQDGQQMISRPVFQRSDVQCAEVIKEKKWMDTAKKINTVLPTSFPWLALCVTREAVSTSSLTEQRGISPPPRPTREPVTVPRRRGGNGKLSTSTFLRKSWKFSLKHLTAQVMVTLKVTIVTCHLIMRQDYREGLILDNWINNVKCSVSFLPLEISRWNFNSILSRHFLIQINAPLSSFSSISIS